MVHEPIWARRRLLLFLISPALPVRSGLLVPSSKYSPSPPASTSHNAHVSPLVDFTSHLSLASYSLSSSSPVSLTQPPPYPLVLLWSFLILPRVTCLLHLDLRHSIMLYLSILIPTPQPIHLFLLFKVPINQLYYLSMSISLPHLPFLILPLVLNLTITPPLMLPLPPPLFLPMTCLSLSL